MMNKNVAEPVGGPPPLVVITSSESAAAPGHAVYNGGYKLYNLWAQLLRSNGVPAYIGTFDGGYSPWMTRYAPHIDMQSVYDLEAAGVSVIYVSAWLPAAMQLGRQFCFYDCEAAYTAGGHASLLKTGLADGRIMALATNSVTQQAWYKMRHDLYVRVIPEWSDTDVWGIGSGWGVTRPVRVGYMRESQFADEEAQRVASACHVFGVDIDLVKIEGCESRVLSAMQSCQIFLGMNHGKWKLGEGCPRTQQEAMHAGCVLVSFDVFGNRAYIVDGYTGFVVPVGDTLSMAMAVASLSSDWALLNAMRSRSVAYARDVLSEDGKFVYVKRFLSTDDVVLHGVVHGGDLDQPSIGELRGAFGDSCVYINEAEIPVLYKYAAMPDVNTVLEVGAGFGSSTVTLLSALVSSSVLSKARLFSIDSFVQDSMGSFRSSLVQCYQNVCKFMGMRHANYAVGCWAVLPYTSKVARDRWAYGEIDMLFLDGDHDYDAVASDLALWSGLVRPGGYILLHDSCRNPDAIDGKRFDCGWQGPTRLAKEMRTDDRFEFVESAYSLTVWRVL